MCIAIHLTSQQIWSVAFFISFQPSFHTVCSPTAVHSAGAAAALPALAEEAAGVPVCQCLLWWSHTSGAVCVRPVLLHRTGVDCTLLRPSGKRWSWNQSTLHRPFPASASVVLMFLLFVLGTGSLLSQLDWFNVAGVTLFIGASVLQHQSMVLLARLRTGKSGERLRFSLLNTSLCLFFLQSMYA